MPEPTEALEPAAPLEPTTQTGPRSVQPMKEGRARAAGDIPDWLVPYADLHDPVRAVLTTPEVPLFDSLWNRACGLEEPGLSGREQDHLIAFLSTPLPTQGEQNEQEAGPQ